MIIDLWSENGHDAFRAWMASAYQPVMQALAGDLMIDDCLRGNNSAMVKTMIVSFGLGQIQGRIPNTRGRL